MGAGCGGFQGQRRSRGRDRNDGQRGQLCESRRLANEEVLCFGDSENDLEMLQEFRYGHIMRNAEEPLLAQVNHIAPANTAYGVLRVIENYTGIPIGKEQA